ncbi:MAG: hypothetical protein K9J81_12630 [Desulfohalobiaceae bacterium]|nr:hypothetical protein [Desulfohalobiaceae bacterium]
MPLLSHTESGEQVKTTQCNTSVPKQSRHHNRMGPESVASEVREEARTINCNQLLENIVAEYEQSPVPGLRLSASLDPLAVPLKCLPLHLAQALKAFISLARLRVRQRQAIHPDHAGLVHLRSKQLSKWQVIEIYDNGIIIQEDQVKALFGSVSGHSEAARFRALSIIEKLHAGHVLFKTQAEGDWKNCIRLLMPV